MTLLLAIYQKDGEKFFSFTDIHPDESIIDFQLMNNFIDVFKEFSKSLTQEIQTIHTIQGFNLHISIKTYLKYTIILAIDQKLDELILAGFFHGISTDMENYLQSKKLKEEMLENKNNGNQTIDELTQTIRKTLSPLLNTGYTFSDLQVLPDTKPLLKIGLLGNAKAGKSSILKKFFDNWQIDSLTNIKATIRLEIVNKFETFLQQNVHTFDFGGQKTFIESYLSKKDIWENFVLLIFVIDITQPDNFEPSFEYLSQIIEHLEKTNIKIPKISLFIHKYDPDKRSNLKQNLQLFIELFNMFSDATVSLYLTSIYDASSNIALIQSLYFSMPEVMIELILEEQFIHKFEERILQPFISQQWSESHITMLQILEKEIRQLVKEKSSFFGAELQRQWLQTLINQQSRNVSKKSTDLINIYVKGQEILIKIKDWSHKNISNEIVVPLLSWTLEGVANTFYLHEIKFIRERDHYLYWIIER